MAKVFHGKGVMPSGRTRGKVYAKGGNKLDIRIEMPSDDELKRMFDAVAVLDRYKIGDQVVKSGVDPIVRRARQLAPRDRSGHGMKRSKNQKAAANWNYPLWKTIKRVIRKYQRGTLGVVGPEWPLGNKAYFNTSPGGREVYYWGKAAGKVAPQIRNWIMQAFEETRSEQLSIMKNKLRELMDKAWRG